MCFVHGERLKSDLVCVVVPDEDALKNWTAQNNIKVCSFQ